MHAVVNVSGTSDTIVFKHAMVVSVSCLIARNTRGYITIILAPKVTRSRPRSILSRASQRRASRRARLRLFTAVTVPIAIARSKASQGLTVMMAVKGQLAILRRSGWWKLGRLLLSTGAQREELTKTEVRL